MTLELAGPVIQHATQHVIQDAPAPPSTTGIITASGVVGVFVTTLTGLFTVWLKWGPKWRELGNNQKRYDTDSLWLKLNALEAKVALADARAAEAKEESERAKMTMIWLNAAFELVASELEKRNPGNEVLAQARKLLSMAVTDDRRMVESLIELSKVKPEIGNEH